MQRGDNRTVRLVMMAVDVRRTTDGGRRRVDAQWRRLMRNGSGRRWSIRIDRVVRDDRIEQRLRMMRRPRGKVRGRMNVRLGVNLCARGVRRRGRRRGSPTGDMRCLRFCVHRGDVRRGAHLGVDVAIQMMVVPAVKGQDGHAVGEIETVPAIVAARSGQIEQVAVDASRGRLRLAVEQRTAHLARTSDGRMECSRTRELTSPLTGWVGVSTALAFFTMVLQFYARRDVQSSKERRRFQ